ncbi:hypothetical protein [Ammoniphilus sp. 3BR4]|uniref:hypothetical protein n=1 Tax=Ammoniphilus sp. 3BR4 TaxID=3158265 RepID=UPI003466DCFA
MARIKPKVQLFGFEQALSEYIGIRRLGGKNMSDRQITFWFVLGIGFAYFIGTFMGQLI